MNVMKTGSQLEQAVRPGGRQNMPLLTLSFDLLTLKSVWESHVTGVPLCKVASC